MENTGIRKIAYSAVLVALGITLGYALAVVPNVELVSFTCVMAGMVMGLAWGAVDGALIFGLYSMLSPFGMPPVPLWVSQILAGVVMGIAGHLARKKLHSPIYAGAIGVALTLFYDLLTNAAGYFAFPTKQTFTAYLIGGLTFAVIHIASNGVIFAVLFPIISKKFAPEWGE